jgi:hypothetical protein
MDAGAIGDLLDRIGPAHRPPPDGSPGPDPSMLDPQQLTGARRDLAAAVAALDGEIPGDPAAGGPGAPAAATPAAIDARDALAAFGIGLPAGVGASTVDADRTLVAEGRRRLTLADEAVARALVDRDTAATHTTTAGQATDPAVRDAETALADTWLDRAAVAANDAAAALFGDGFRLLPLIAPPAASDLFASAADVASGPHPLATESEIRGFLLDMASVRPQLDDYADLLVQADALGRAPRHRLIQLAAGDDPGAAAWIARPFEDRPTPVTPVTSLVVESAEDVDPDQPLAGLVIDDWSEVVPVRVAHTSTLVSRNGGPATVEPLVTTGLALNANGPDARPPQAILLAVSPDGDRWTTDRLVDTLEETMELARLRLVSLERVALAARVLPALQVQSWSLQGDPALDLTQVVTALARADKMVRYVKDS